MNPLLPVASSSAKSLLDYLKREAETPVAGELYPLAKELSPLERHGYLLMIETETSRVQAELDDIREARRKLRDMTLTGLVALVGVVIVMFSASGSGHLTKAVVGFLGYVLVVAIQILTPGVLSTRKQREETAKQAELEALRHVRVEFLYEEKRAEIEGNTPASARDEEQR